MFPSLLVLWLCLFVWRISAQEESATPPPAAFDFPVADGLIINTIDTVVLQWTSEFQQAFLQMWCQNGSAGNNVVLGRSTLSGPTKMGLNYIRFPCDQSFTWNSFEQTETNKSQKGVHFR